MLQGMPRVKHVEQFYDTFILTKQRQLSFPCQASFPTKEKLELMHGDLCGPVTPATPGGRYFFLLLIDDGSHYMGLVLLDTKATAADAIKLLRRSAATSFECYAPTTATSSRWLSSRCTALTRGSSATSPRRTPHSRMTSLSVTTRRWWPPPAPSSSREDAGNLLGEAVMTAIHLLNRSPTQALDGKMSYEAWHRRKLVVSHFCVFCCLTFTKELNHVSKLDDWSTPGVFIGYAEGIKAYRILDPMTQCVLIS
jgi:hypothetical protein